MHSKNNSEISSIQKVIADVVDLFELQMELMSVDSQEAKRKLVKAGVYFGIATPLAGSALTVVMVGSGFLLGELTWLSVGEAMLIMGVFFFAVVAGLLFFAFRAVKGAVAAMSETKSEFTENLRWLKATLISPSTSARNQIRREPSAGPQMASYSSTHYVR